MKYLPLGQRDKQEMLDFLGAERIEDLFEMIPDRLINRDLEIPEAIPEMSLRQFFDSLAEKNRPYGTSFLGAGIYRHFCPVVVDRLSQRQEFLTSYTPYQPEIAQGTLQYLFEFQTMFAQLTGMEVANASMYDGATATVEAILMAARLKSRRRRVLVSDAIHPHYIDTIKTYLESLPLDLEMIPLDGDFTSIEALEEKLDSDVCAVVVGYPNFLGCVEPIQEIAALAHGSGALMVTSTTEALSLALLKPPGHCGADMVVGEAQSFGLPTQFGGPLLGFFTTRDRHKRQMPGRICGMTKDRNEQRAFVLTLNTREQHIRRAKATSNICSNQGLCALRATIYLSCMGKEGLRELALQNHAKCEYLKDQLIQRDLGSVAAGPHFNEFVLTLSSDLEHFTHQAKQQDMLVGLDLSEVYPARQNQLLVAVTETVDRDQLDRFCDLLEGLV